MLARREHSRLELERKLSARLGGQEVAPERIDRVLDELAETGLQSDFRCAEMLIHSRAERGNGPLRIRSDLRERGIEGEAIQALLESEADQWPQRLQALVVKRFKDEAPADAREWARRARFLASRGFPESMVRDALGDCPF